jgi:hypothetical protein
MRGCQCAYNILEELRIPDGFSQAKGATSYEVHPVRIVIPVWIKQKVGGHRTPNSF